VRPFFPLVLLPLLACGTRATQVPCPGEVQGTFQVVAELVDAGACADALRATTPLDLTVTVSFTGDSGAALCLQRPLADPLVGTREGDRIEVSAPVRASSARGCACTAQLVEGIAGSLERADETGVGFSGELRVEVSPADGSSSCAPSADGDVCAVPCSVRWTLTSD
jgi:hypothetical protein